MISVRMSSRKPLPHRVCGRVQGEDVRMVGWGALSYKGPPLDVVINTGQIDDPVALQKALEGRADGEIQLYAHLAQAASARALNNAPVNIDWVQLS